MPSPWKRLSSETVHKNPWYSVRRDAIIRPDGKPGEFYVVEREPSVFIVALTPEQKVHLIGIHRYTTGSYSFQVPAGGSEGQPLLEAAQRELQEETGLTAKTWEKLGVFEPANGLLQAISHVFLATDLSQTTKNAELEEGIQEHKICSFEEIREMIKNGEMPDGPSVTCLTMAALKLNIW